MTRAARAADDAGSTLILVSFYCFLGLVLVLIVTAATSLHLERKRLFTIADGAALAAAEAFTLGEVAVTADGPRPTLTDASVAEAAGEYLADAPTDLDGVRLERGGTDDGLSATVTVSSAWTPPVITVFVAAGLRLEVTATARSVFG
jgi:hypothetical protein